MALGPPGFLRMLLKAKLTRDRSATRRTHYRVSLPQIDVNVHMNQACYAQVLELARVEWILGTRRYNDWQVENFNPVVAEQRIEYRRELKLFQAYQIDTRFVGMDGRLLVFEQHLLVGEVVHAKATVKLIFVGPQGVVSAERMATMNEGWSRPRLNVQKWRVVS